MWGWESILVTVLLSLPAMCRVHHPISDEEEIESHQQSEYNYYRHWETDPQLANDLEHSALNADKRGLILDNYSHRSVVAITGDNNLSGKLPAISRIQTQLKTNNDHNDDHKSPEDDSDDVCDQELAHDTNISQDNVMNDASDLKGLNNDTIHLDKSPERVRMDEERKSRIFSIFSLVRFKNEACTPSGTKNTYLGTCYLATECAERVRGMKIHMTQYTHNMNCLSLKHAPRVRNQGDCVLVDGI